MRDVQKSKLLSLVLRHKPQEIGITLDEAGWTRVSDLLDALTRYGEPMSQNELEALVASSDKQRFALNADHSMIRANQGHSVSVDLGLEPTTPPETLFHGTARRFVASILREGLSKKMRHHVHLHADHEIALVVGKRRGEAVILAIDAAGMHANGHRFYRTNNDVWLTDGVPPQYISPV
jgi:putative RNA 2'-phosphotransferase